MSNSFKVWNQGHDGRTMGIRVEDLAELQNLAPLCSQPDIAGTWPNLSSYLQAAAVATGTAPAPYTRVADVVWLSQTGYGAPQYFPGRTFVVTYTGPERKAGGFASQAYCIVDPDGYGLLAPYDKDPLQAVYIAHPLRDVIVVM